MDKRTVNFDGLNSKTDLNITFASLVIGDAKPKRVTVDVPYANGKLDLTDYFGAIRYENRTISMRFIIPLSKNHMSVYHNVQKLLNGQNAKIVFSADDEWYYYGRLSVGGFSVDGGRWAFTIEADAEPYQYQDVEVTKSIVASDFTEDTAPYSYRASSGERVIPTLVGGTVAWNQLVDAYTTTTRDGITTSYNSTTHKFKIKNDSRTTNYNSGSTQGILVSSLTAGRVYFTDFTPQVVGVGTTSSSNSALNGMIFKQSEANMNLGLRVTNAYDFVTAHPVGDETEFYLNVIDLTQMFGSTIADYVYSLEQATEGSGIAWLKSYGFFTESYYAYNSGELISANPSARKVVGFNQWDEEWEVGTLNTSTGANQASSTRIRSKNFIPILPNTEYCYEQSQQGGQSTGRACYYDKDKNFISGTTWFPNGSSGFVTPATFVTPDGACFMKFSPTSEYGTTYNNDICINISDANKNGTYEPYKLTTYPLGSDTLRGIYKLSGSNLYCDGDVKTSDGTVTRKYREYTFDGTESWTLANEYWYCQLKNTYSVNYGTTGTNNISQNGVLCNIVNGNYVRVFFSRNASITSETNMSALFANGTKFVYELATPTTESSSAFQSPQIVGSTEEVVSDVPCGQDSYYFDAISVEMDGEQCNESPTITNTVPIILEQGNVSVSVTTGTHKVDAILPEDVTIIPTTPNAGTVTINYRKGRL